MEADASIRAGNEETSLSVVNNNSSTTIAFIRHAWNELPEIWYGNFSQQTRLTRLNDAIHKPLLRTENLTWTNEDKHVQGWLLFPQNYDSTKHYPKIRLELNLTALATAQTNQIFQLHLIIGDYMRNFLSYFLILISPSFLLPMP